MMNIRIITVALILLSGFATARAQFAGGSGTVENPWQVATLDQLQLVRSYADRHFVQIDDIDASPTQTWHDGAGFRPIGDGTVNFTGSYDGGEYRITDLWINRSETGVGLFGIGSGATLENIILENAVISGGNDTGALAGYLSESHVKNITLLNVEVSSSIDYVGGLVGRVVDTAIRDVDVSSDVSARRYLGGVAGQLSGSGSMSNANVTGKVSVGNWGYAGGLIGINYVEVDSSYVNVNVNVTGTRTGGLIGDNRGNVRNSSASGNVTSTSNYVGGLAGYHSGTISGSHASGTVSGGNQTGGLTGYNTSAQISDSYATGQVTGDNQTGGLTGYNLNTQISDSYATGQVTGDNQAGGLVGDNRGDIFTSYASGNVNGADKAGGLAGENRGNVRDTYATGDVDGAEEAGGLIGSNVSGADVKWSFSTGKVTGTDDVGGLVGLNGGTVSASYWNTVTSELVNGMGRGPSTDVTGLNTDQMTGHDAFLHMDVLDFDDTWHLTANYPALQWEDVVPLFLLPRVTLISPADEASDLTLPVTLVWEPDAAIDRYQLQIAEDSGFSSLAIDTTSTATEFTDVQTRLDYDTTYYWRVRGVDDEGNGAWSGIRKFSTEPLGFAGGSGTEAEPWEVANVRQLQEIRNNLDKHFIQVNDIDATLTKSWNDGKGFTPIGTSASKFTGSYDGGGYDITGLRINRNDLNHVGLFGFINEAQISDVSLSDLQVTNYRNWTSDRTGGLTGEAENSLIERVFISGGISGIRDYTGGISGRVVNTDLLDIEVAADITGRNYTGGLTGELHSGTISGSGFTGNVTGVTNYIGGLAGRVLSQGKITSSYAKGTLSGNYDVGGLTGDNQGVLGNVYARIDVSGGDNKIGGLTGRNFGSGLIEYAYSTGKVTGTGTIGGLAGVNDAALQFSYWDIENNEQDAATGGGTGMENHVSGKTTEQMTGLSAFHEMEGLEFGQIWKLTESYPALMWEDVDELESDVAQTLLTSPADGATGITIPVTMTWQEAENADRYQIMVAEDSTFQNVAISTTGSFTEFTDLAHYIFYDSTYYWRVRGLSDEGVGPWSDVHSFTVESFSYSGGTGTAVNPFEIENIHQLQRIRTRLHNHFIMVSDVDASATRTWNNGDGFAPLGDIDLKFTGSFDGRGHVIAGLWIDRSATSRTGLFGFTEQAEIKNVTLQDANVAGGSETGILSGESVNTQIENAFTSGTVSGGWSNTGGLAGRTDDNTVISESGSEATVSASGSNVGGLTGHNRGSIYHSRTNGNVTGQTDIGGLTGFNEGLISGSRAVGLVTGTGDRVGGLVGRNRNGSITSSYASGDVTSGGNDIGGLAGINQWFGASITGCFASGAVTGNLRVGGLAGNNSQEISNSYATGDVGGSDQAGGLIGANLAGGNVISTFSTGKVNSSGDDVGGLVGLNSESVELSYWDTETSEKDVGVGRGADEGVTGLTTDMMTGTDAYDHMDGLEYRQYWYLTDGYPALQWEDVDPLDPPEPLITLLSPANNATGVQLPVTLEWRESPLSDSYQIQVALDEDFEEVVLDSTLTVAELTEYSMRIAFNQTRYWRVRGQNEEGPWSIVYEFRTTALQVAGGAGTEENPYQIADIYQLQSLRDNANHYYVQIADIDASVTSGWHQGRGFEPITAWWDAFHYDGNGKEITGLWINRPESNDVGLFANVNLNLKDLTLSNVDITGNSWVGGLVGRLNTGSVTRSHVSGSVTGTGNSVGGLAGNMGQGTLVSHSSSSASVTGVDATGGLVGGLDNGEILGSFAEGAVSVPDHTGGGLAGWSSGNIANSYATGTVSGGNQLGGLVGFLQNGSETSFVFSTGKVDGTNTGGLAGYLGGSLSYAYWDVETSEQSGPAGTDNGEMESVTGLQTSEMTGLQAVEFMTGFDFEEEWITTDSYPALFWQDPSAPVDPDEPTVTLVPVAESPLTVGIPFRIDVHLTELHEVPDLYGISFKMAIDHESASAIADSIVIGDIWGEGVIDTSITLIDQQTVEVGIVKTDETPVAEEGLALGVYFIIVDPGQYSVVFSDLKGITTDDETVPLRVEPTLFEVEESPEHMLAAPKLLAPQDFATGRFVNEVLRWQAVPNAEYYELQLYDGELTLLEQVTDITDEFYELENLETGTTYHWRIRGQSADSIGLWSGLWRFTVAEERISISGRQTADADGGLIEISDNLELHIPPAALDTLVEIEYGLFETVPDGRETFGTMIMLGPEGTVFDIPVEITMPYDPEELPEERLESDLVIFRYDRSGQRWEELESTVNMEDNKVAAAVSQFSGFVVGLPEIPEITFANVQWPESGEIMDGDEFLVYALVEAGELTENGPSAEIEAFIGYSSNDSEPDGDDWTWVDAEFNLDYEGQGHEYFADIGSDLLPGEYYYASKFVLHDIPSYGGYQNGFWDGVNNVSGHLIVVDPWITALDQPDDEATDVSLFPEFTWQTVTSEPPYTLQIMLDPGHMNNPWLEESGISGNSYTPDTRLEPATWYYWRVGFSSVREGRMKWTNTHSFRTVDHILIEQLYHDVSPADELVSHLPLIELDLTTELVPESLLDALQISDSDGNHYTFTVSGSGNGTGFTYEITPEILRSSDDITVHLQSELLVCLDQRYSASGHDTTFQFRTALLGDFNIDGTVGSSDLAVLIENWRMTDDLADISIIDIGPATGTPPMLTAVPDGIIDLDDLVVFATNWLASFSTDRAQPPLASLNKTSGDSLLTVHSIGVLPDPPESTGRDQGKKADQDLLTLDVPDELRAVEIILDEAKPVYQTAYSIPDPDRNIRELALIMREERSVMVFELRVDTPDEISMNEFLPHPAFEKHGGQTFSMVREDPGGRGFVMTAGNLGGHVIMKPGDTLAVVTIDHQDLDQGTVTYAYSLFESSETFISERREHQLDLSAPVPDEFKLLANFPNPFNPSTTIRYHLPEQSNVRILVYDVLGRLVNTLLDTGVDPGYHQVIWDGTRNASGVYLYVIQARGESGERFQDVQKMMLVK